MIKCTCTGCNAEIEVGEDSAGTAVMCKQCGCVIQVPELEQVKPLRAAPAAAAKKPAAAPPKGKRGYIIIGVLYGLYLVCIPFSLMNAQTGSPMCLVMFGINMLLGTGAGFLFCVGLHTPDYLTDWLRMPYTRLRIFLVWLPLMLLAFAMGYHVYSP